MKPTKPNTEVTCHHCEGKGKIPLSDEMQETLDAALKMRRVTAPGLCKKLNWKGHVTAINNRLRDLMYHGFFTRNREGRDFVYTPVKN